uniref:lipocalin-like domain-containing protein n=1 Tax=Marinobacterium profundum TaxID=1714300 RepID=UPI000832C0D8|nr:lipocalin-like domain-containing protein [Marinobacterium profundum]
MNSCLGRWRPWVGILLLLLLLLLLAGSEPAPPPQGDATAVLSEQVSPEADFAQAQPGMTVSLPQDMGAHPDYRLEWWYLNANLRSETGEAFGVQWTLFRMGLGGQRAEETAMAGWYGDELWLAHAALSQPGRHRFASKLGRGGSGQAGVVAAPFEAWIDDWQLSALQQGGWALQTQAGDFGYRLQLMPTLAAVKHGNQGFSAKSAVGGGSMYFSYPALAISGEITLDGKTHQVSGQGWFDREWSSQLLQPDQRGWDWMALHLDDGRRLMLFRIRGKAPFYAASLIQADGSSQALSPDEFSLQPLAFRDSRRGQVPVRWQVRVPAAGIELEVTAWPGDFWNPGRLSYWEGPVEVSGSHRGEGYLEMTGYGD